MVDASFLLESSLFDLVLSFSGPIRLQIAIVIVCKMLFACKDMLLFLKSCLANPFSGKSGNVSLISRILQISCSFSLLLFNFLLLLLSLITVEKINHYGKTLQGTILKHIYQRIIF